MSVLKYRHHQLLCLKRDRAKPKPAQCEHVWLRDIVTGDYRCGCGATMTQMQAALQPRRWHDQWFDRH